MSRIEWRVDSGTQIVLRNSLFSRRKIELNGQPVEGEWRSKAFPFTLPDGRNAEIRLKADSFSRMTELSINGKVIPDKRYLPEELRCPACKAEIQLLDEYCASCGNHLGAPDRYLYNRQVEGATGAIKLLAVLYLIFGLFMFFMTSGQTEEALKNLEGFADHETLMPIDGVTYTAGELRKRVVWEHRGVLVVNIILSVIMLVLAWWSKFKPLSAILIATAIYAAVIVISAIIEPMSLLQGIIMKIIIIGVLVKGIKASLAAREENG